jgi:hypothetical protein
MIGECPQINAMKTRKKQKANAKTKPKRRKQRSRFKTVRHSDGSRTCCEYDANGKCVAFFDLAPTLAVTYHYNRRGKLLRVVRHRKPKPM